MVQDSPDSIRSSGCLLCYSILRVPPTTNVRLLRSPKHCLINWSVSCSQRGDLGRLRARETARGEGAERSPESSYGHYSSMTWALATLTSDIFSTQLWHVHPCNACANPGEVSGCLPPCCGFGEPCRGTLTAHCAQRWLNIGSAEAEVAWLLRIRGHTVFENRNRLWLWWVGQKQAARTFGLTKFHRPLRRRQKGGSSDVLSRVRVLSRFTDFFSMCFMNHHVRRGCLCDRIASDPTQGIEV